MAGFLGFDLLYRWMKAAHLIFVIFWIAGLLILPRYYVYHAGTAPGSAEDRAWVEREARLRRVIVTPAMIFVWLLGMALAINIGAFAMGWFHAKLALVIGLSAYHGWMVGYGRKLDGGHRPASDKTLRLLNEVPSLATIAIVILVIVKPF